MPQDRFFLPDPFSTGKHLALDERELHHLRTVMRVQVGEEVELVNGQHQLATARVDRFDAKSASLMVLHVTEQPAPTRRLILAMASLRMAKLEWVIEKGTELGASAFWIFPADKSEKGGLSPHQLERLQLLAIAAMKQCGRLDLPLIEERPPLTAWTPSSGQLLFADLAPQAVPLWTLPLSTEATLLIGPEGGWSPAERNHLTNCLRATCIQLHPNNTLRAETASLAALTLALATPTHK